MATDAELELARWSSEAASRGFALMTPGSKPAGISPGSWQRQDFEGESSQVTLVLD